VYYQTEEDNSMDEREMAKTIQQALEAWYENEVGETVGIRSYEDEGVMTYNEGLVVRLPDGSAFQLTVVRCR
jgi:hypothetical protein